MGVESLLLLRFTGDACSVAFIAVVLLMVFLPAGHGRLFLTVVLTLGTITAICCLAALFRDLNRPAAIVILAQGAQFIALRRRHCGDSNVADGFIFTVAGMVCACTAYAFSLIPLSLLFAEFAGTSLLILVFLQHDGWISGPGARHAGTLSGCFMRLVIILPVIAVSLIIASAAAYPLRQGADKVWLILERYGTPGSSAGERKMAGMAGNSEEGEMALELGVGSGRSRPHEPAVHLVIRRETAGRLQKRQRMYLTVSTFDSYATNRWVNSTERKMRVDEEDGSADGRVVFTGPAMNPVAYSVLLKRTMPDALPGIPGIAAVDQTAVEYDLNGNCYSPLSLKSAEKIMYVMESSDARWDDLKPGEKVAGAADAVFRRLPAGDFSGRVRQLARTVTGGSRELDRVVENIRGYLWKEYRYSSPAGGHGGFDPLNDFLFGDRTGNCRYFASGFVFLMRAAGFPARISSGYCGGEYDPVRRILTFYQDEGHAWAEVFVADRGWVLVDPTPPSAAAPSAPRTARFSGELRLADALNVADIVKQRYSGRLALNQEVRASWVDRMFTGVSPTIWLCLLMMIVSAIVIIVARFHLSEPMKPRDYPGLRANAAPSYFRLFCSYFAGLGCKLRAGQTVKEYLSELKQSSLVENECDGLVSYFYDTSYGKLRPSRSEEKKYKSVVNSLKEKNRRGSM